MGAINSSGYISCFYLVGKINTIYGGIVFVFSRKQKEREMKKLFIALAAVTLLACFTTSCRSAKQGPDYDKVDKDFKDFKERNPD
jgi:hypothetical protein